MLFNLSWALEESNRYLAAIGFARRALELREGTVGTDNPELQLYVDQVAKIERRLGNVNSAKLLETRSEALKTRAELDLTDPMQTPASVVEQVRPLYPATARRMGWQGRSVVRALIGVDGTVRQTTIQESSGDRLLDDSAMASVQGSRYWPARSRGGRAMASVIRMPISFVLDSSAPHFDGAQHAYAFRVAQAVRSNVVQGVPVRVTLPAEISLRVAPDGTILDYALTKSSGDPVWDAAAMSGVARTVTLPLDINGLAPSLVVLSMNPNE